MRRPAPLPVVAVLFHALLLTAACGADDGGGSSGPSSGGPMGALGTAGLGAAYGHLCSADADCRDVAGTVCVSLGSAGGMCLKPVAPGGICPTGTVAERGTLGACLRDCANGASCASGTECRPLGATGGLPASTQVCGPPLPRTALSPIGGACLNDGQCAGSARCATNLPGGYCSMPCASDATVCGTSAVCVRTSSTDAFCFARCAAPGTQSSCRMGYSCKALEGKTFGACG